MGSSLWGEGGEYCHITNLRLEVLSLINACGLYLGVLRSQKEGTPLRSGAASQSGRCLMAIVLLSHLDEEPFIHR